MRLRPAFVVLTLGPALAASIASPPSGPETQQAPLWSADAWYDSGGMTEIAAGETHEIELEAAFTLPSGGSGGWTDRLTVNLYFEEGGYAGAATATLTDAAGAPLDDATYAVPLTAGASSTPLVAQEFMAECEAGARCTGTVILTLTATDGPLSYSVNASFSARDNQLGAEVEYVDASLTATPR